MQKLAKYSLGYLLDKRAKNAVQDPYSFRCIPQVHGATLDTINFVIDIIQKEINAVTDNPVLLSDSTIKSGGNFHSSASCLVCRFSIYCNGRDWQYFRKKALQTH